MTSNFVNLIMQNKLSMQNLKSFSELESFPKFCKLFSLYWDYLKSKGVAIRSSFGKPSLLSYLSVHPAGG